MIERASGDFLQWLRGFHHVVTHGTTAAAAAAMGVRQPTVSHQIKMLEADLGVRLFQRTMKRMVLTPEGKALHERAIVLFEQIRGIKEEVGRPQKGALKGDVPIITTHSVASNYLPCVIRGFLSRNPDVSFTLTGATEFAAILRQVQNSSVELGIVHGYVFPDTIEYIPLFSSPLVLIVSKKHAAQHGWHFTASADGSLADMTELNNMPYVAFSPQATMTHHLHEILSKHKIKVKTTVRVNTSSLLSRYVASGFGATIIDAFTAASHPGAFDCYRLANDVSDRIYHIVYRKKTYISPQVRSFIEYMRENTVHIEGLCAPVCS